MMLFQSLAMKGRVTYDAEATLNPPSRKKGPAIQGAFTTVHDGPVEYGKVYSYPLKFGDIEATLKLDFARTEKGIVAADQYVVGPNGLYGQTDRRTNDPMGDKYGLSGHFSLTDRGTTTTYDTFKITVTDLAANKVKIEINSDIVVKTGVKEPAMAGITMAALNSADFKGNVSVTLPQGGRVKLDMVNILSQSVASVSENLPPGTSNLHLNIPYEAKAGVYFIMLSGIDGVAPLTKKVIVQ